MAATFQEARGTLNIGMIMNAPALSETSHHLAVSDRAVTMPGGMTHIKTEAQTGRALPTVLHFIYAVGGGGAEAMMRSLASHLDRRHWRVVVVALQAKNWPEETARLREAVDVLHVLEETALLSGGTLKKLSRVIRTERPDVVQTWMHHADFTGGLVARFCGVRQVVWGIHCREITRAPGESALKAWLFARLMPLLARWVPGRIISCSQAAVEDHVTLGYPPSEMTWIPNGVDTSRFKPCAQARQEMRARLGLSDDAPLIGFVGRAHEMKNLPLLLRAFGLLNARLPEARLVLCGVRQEDLDQASRAESAALPHPEAVFWLPFQANPEQFYPGLDLFTLSSRTEACPMTILEAMACGLPCVTTDVGDCGALIGEAGAVVPAGDAQALADAWQAVLKRTPEERAALGEAARRRLVAEFSLERAAARYQELYETLIPSAQS